MKHEKRKFVENLDYLTSPGWLGGGKSRSEAGLGEGGPFAVITDLGIMEFGKESGRMFLKKCYKGVMPSRIRDNTGFDLDVSGAGEELPPTERELEILRERCDPQRLILG